MKEQKKKHEEGLYYRVVVTDKEGKVLHEEAGPSKSFVQQWNQLTNVQAKGTASTITDTGGVGRSISPYSVTHKIQAAAGVTTYGLRVGKGSTAVAITDYALETPVVHGVGAGQLNHLASTYTAPAVVGSDCSFTIKRNFINQSGATVTGIREIGAYMQMSASYFALAFRDVLVGSIDVPDGGAVTAEYTIKVSA